MPDFPVRLALIGFGHAGRARARPPARAHHHDPRRQARHDRYDRLADLPMVLRGGRPGGGAAAESRLG